LREEVFQCDSVSVAGAAFQACSFNHSDISPSLESTAYSLDPIEIVAIVRPLMCRDHLRVSSIQSRHRCMEGPRFILR
jgi:hypothetical protein